MAVIVCPWCQSEVTQEEGQEPDKFCPICDNELDGYRTLRVDIGGLDGEEDDIDDEDEGSGVSFSGPGGGDEEDLSWEQDDELRAKDRTLLAYEETVEKLLDEQEVVPECPQCREYMLEAGERIVRAETFNPRTSEPLGEPLLGAPYGMTVYVCPSCFAVQEALGEEARNRLARRLSGESRSGGDLS